MTDPDVEQAFARWCAERKERQRAFQRRPAVGGTLFEPGRRNADGSYYHVYRRLPVRTPLVMPRVFLQGPKWRQFNVTFVRKGRVQHHPCLYDFADDVRELVCEPIRFDVYAMWNDPREWASVMSRSTR